MSYVDWWVFISFTIAIIAGAYSVYSPNTRPKDDYIGGRNIPWYITGTSMSATSLSSDTPLLVAGLVFSQGISGNWIWWIGAPAVFATAFYFARLWWRSGVSTEMELMTFRYGSSRASKLLRAYKALSDGFIFNALLIASITLAFNHIAQQLGFSESWVFTTSSGEQKQIFLITLLVFFCVVGYTILVGLRGVIFSDIMQFCLAILISWIMIAVALKDKNISGLLSSLSEDKTSFFPQDTDGSNITYFWVFILCAWCYRAAGSGPLVQRVITSRSEKDAVKALLWHSFLHFVLRSWPWIVIGLLAISVLSPSTSVDSVYPRMMLHLLPEGLTGLGLACLLAAYVSTLDTHLNWGSSLIVNDIWEQLSPSTEKTRYRYIASITLLSLFSLLLLFSGIIEHLLFTYEYLMVIYSGLASVTIARWYWWRMNIWGEISCHISAIIFGNFIFWYIDSSSLFWFSVPMLLNLILSAIIMVITVILTTTDSPDEPACNFYKVMKIDAVGWRKVAVMTQQAPIKTNATLSFTYWILSLVILSFGMKFSIELFI